MAAIGTYVSIGSRRPAAAPRTNPPESMVMCRVLSGLLLAAVLAVPAAARAADGDAPAPGPQIVALSPPPFPTPMQTSILGLSLTAVAVVGARVSRRNSDTMMFMVL